MEPLDKLELMIKLEIKKKSAERERGKDKHSILYIESVDTEITTLRRVLCDMADIWRGATHTSDNMINRLYGDT